MINVRQVTTATKEITAWLKASSKTSILQTKPQINIDFNKIKYITPQFDKNFSVENLVKNYLQSKEFTLPTTRNTEKNNIKSFLSKINEKISRKVRENFYKGVQNGNHNKQPIHYLPAKTAQEAIEFGKTNGLYKRVIGLSKNPNEIKVGAYGINYPSDLEILNTLNESLCKIHNRTNGTSFMPSKIKLFGNIKSADGVQGVASFSQRGNVLSINNQFVLDPFTIYHEMGHAQHACKTNIDKLGRIEELYAKGITDGRVTNTFLQDKEMLNLITKTFRPYAASSPAEYCADYFAHSIAGDIKIPYKMKNLYDALMDERVLKLTRS